MKKIVQIKQTNKDRNNLIDIMKAIGIISIVIGHSCEILPGTEFKIAQFVYSYHIMVFLFVSGFCFRKEYSLEPFSFVGKRLKGVLFYYLGYNVLFIIFHNYLSRIYIIPSGFYTLDNIISSLAAAITFNITEILLGTFWFIPMFLLANIIFCFVFYFSEKFKHAYIVHFLCCLIIALVGLYANVKGMFWDYNLQTSILAIPVLYMGYIVKIFWNRVNKYVNIVIAMFCALFINYILSLNIGIIELSVDWIINQWVFYPVTFMGLYFCMGISMVIEKTAGINRLFAYIGKNSFHIMALHFLMFKIVDQIYGRRMGAPIDVLSKFPHAFELWYIYWIAGIFGPLLLIYIGRKLISIFRKNIEIYRMDRMDGKNEECAK